MLLLPSSELPDGEAWLYELKLDGYRAVAFKSAGEVHLRSRNNSDFNRKYQAILKDSTVVECSGTTRDVSKGLSKFDVLAQIFSEISHRAPPGHG